MKYRDIISSLFWLAMGIGITYGGYDLEIGSLNEPGSGFIFFWIGIIMIGLSLIILVSAIRKEGTTGELKKLIMGVRWQKIIPILASLIVYAYVLERLGFIVATVILLIYLFKAVEPQKWSWAVLGAVLSTGAAYGLFHILLGCQLPRGILGVY